MNRTRYQDLVKLAGGWALDPIHHAISAQQIFSYPVNVGVYLACRADMDLLYIGSAVRPGTSGGVAKRIMEHPARHRGSWWWFWVLPLRETTPRGVVLTIEGLAIEILRPPHNRRRHRLGVVPPYLPDMTAHTH